MGFCYGQFGLCCDFCSTDDPKLNVKKIPCPYGYCQAWACCKNCFAKKLHLASSCTNEHKSHKENCKLLSIKANNDQNSKQAILDAGYYIRIAALGHGNLVKVLFINNDGKEKACWMTGENYDQFKLGVTITLEEFKIISMAKNTDIYDSESLEIVQ